MTLPQGYSYEHHPRVCDLRRRAHYHVEFQTTSVLAARASGPTGFYLYTRTPMDAPAYTFLSRHARPVLHVYVYIQILLICSEMMMMMMMMASIFFLLY